jgi:hypothetical protein
MMVWGSFKKWLGRRLFAGPGDAARQDGTRHLSPSAPVCRNCGGKLDHTDFTCPTCGRRITRFSPRL